MNRPYSTLSFVFLGERHAGFFVYTFYSVLFIVQSCSAMIFAAPYEVETRFESILSLLLTVTAMKFVANESLPRISYRTMLDNFMIVSLISTSCVLFLNIKHLFLNIKHLFLNVKHLFLNVKHVFLNIKHRTSIKIVKHINYNHNRHTVVWCCALWSCALTIMAFRTKEEKTRMDQAAAGVYVGVYVLYSIAYMVRVAMVRVRRVSICTQPHIFNDPHTHLNVGTKCEENAGQYEQMDRNWA